MSEKSTPEKRSRSKLAQTVAALAFLAVVSHQSPANQGESEDTRSLIPKDGVVQVFGDNPSVPDGFRAMKSDRIQTKYELDHANTYQKYIVAHDQHGNKGVYRFSIPHDGGKQDLRWVAGDLSELDLAEDEKWDLPNANAPSAEVLTTEKDGLRKQYLLVEHPDEPPVIFEIEPNIDSFEIGTNVPKAA